MLGFPPEQGLWLLSRELSEQWRMSCRDAAYVISINNEAKGAVNFQKKKKITPSL